MEKMQFRDYIFKHNPARIKVTSSNNITEEFCPGTGSLVRNHGQKARTAVCSGSFTGLTSREALEQAEAFRRLILQNQSGILFLPGMEPFPAQLREFVLEAEGDGRILPYTVTFVEQGELI